MAPSKYPMVSIEEAVGAVMDAVAPLEPERVPLVRKSVDGYAFQASGQVMKLRLEDRPALCGAPFSGRPLGSMDCCYVATGAPLPNLADCVAKEEDCEVSAGQKTVVVPALPPRTDVRVPGSDWDAGDVLCEKGTVVAPADLAILAAAGHHEVAAHRLPKVVVFSTGDELWSPEAGHKYDQRTMVRDANRYGLIGLLGGHGEGQAGAEVHDGGIVEDKEFALRSALREAVKHYDVVVTTGGASVGRADHAKAVLEAADRGTVHFGRLHMKPGKPTTFATLDAGSFDKDEKGREKRWLFALPGNPVSALVRLALDHDLPLDGARPEYHRVSLEYRDDGDGARDWSAAPYRFRRAAGSLAATSTGNQRSSRLLSMRGAHALACVPERGRAPLVAAGAGKALPAGTAVPGLLLGPARPSCPSPTRRSSSATALKRDALVAAEADAAGAPRSPPSPSSAARASPRASSAPTSSRRR
ncbi:molybdopterin molybdotransferase [Aureococcus anophagefferens]|nr:molybdopterin molybdotransferase [Aureococcus anophagefferens]